METKLFKQTLGMIKLISLFLLLILFQTMYATCPIQSPNFTTSVNGNTVSITLSGGGYNSYLCGYGDATYGTQLTHSYTTVGVKTICVRFVHTDSLNTANNCDTTICKTIGITNTTPFGCPIQSPGFTANVSGNIVTLIKTGSGYNSYSWTYGDGSSGTINEHTYTTYGVKTICLRLQYVDSTNTSHHCDTTICRTVTLVQPFTCPIENPNFTTSVNGNTVTFTKTGSGYNFYSYNYGDGTTGTSNTHTYSAFGTKTICLKFQYVDTTNTSRHCDTTICKTITLTPNICPIQSPNFTTSVNGNTVAITLAGGGYNSYYIGYGDATYGTLLSHSYNSTGVKTICIKFQFTDSLNTSRNCDTTICKTITINNSTCTWPNLFTSISDSCTASNHSLNGYSTLNTCYKYQWKVNGVVVGTTRTLTYPVTQNGAYAVCLSIIDTCTHCDTTICSTRNITCISTPAPCNWSSHNPYVNFWDSCTATNKSLNGYIYFATGSTCYKYQWKVNGVVVGTTRPFTYPITQNGTYNVCVIVTDTCNHCDTSFCSTRTITCFNNWACPIQGTGFTAVVNGNTVVLTKSGSGYNSYSWTYGDGTTGTSNTHTYTTYGVKTICIKYQYVDSTNTSHHCDTTICRTVELVQPFRCPIENPNFTVVVNGNSVTLTKSGAGYNAYLWNYGDGSTGTSNSHTYTSSGTKTICINFRYFDSTNTTRHCDTTICKTITIAPATFSCPIREIYFSVLVDGNTVTLTKYGSGYTNYLWTYGDGLTGTSNTHTYTSSGVKTICLKYIYVDSTNTSRHCDTTYCKTLTIATNSFVCQLQSVNFTTSIRRDTVYLTKTGGGYTSYIWSYGDGHYGTQNYHVYNSNGTKNICIKFIDSTAIGTCDTVICKTISITAACDSVSCVLPGDADHDFTVNNFDIFAIGLSYNRTGLTRPNATTQYTLQPAPDWPTNSYYVFNDKFVDCNGNGVINNADASVILQNYIAKPYNHFNHRLSGLDSLPPVFLAFDSLPIFQIGNPCNTTEIVSDINVGSPNHVAQNVYGIGFSVEYPPSFATDSCFRIQVDLDANSWFANNEPILYLVKNLPQFNRVDIGIARTTGTPRNGNGKIGKIKFVVEDGIFINGRTSGIKHYSFLVNNVAGVDNFGNNISFSGLPSDPTFIISGVKNNKIEGLKIYPNPANDRIFISAKEIIESVLIYDVSGQVIKQENIHDFEKTMDIGDLSEGMYMIEIRSNNVTSMVKLIKSR